MNTKTIQQQIEGLRQDVLDLREQETMSTRTTGFYTYKGKDLNIFFNNVTDILKSLNERIEEHEKKYSQSKSKRFNLDKDVRECKEDHT